MPLRVPGAAAGLLVGLVACALPLVRAGAPTAFRTADDPEPTEPSEGWYWGSIDANIDWCERNYSTSPYLAEFWNALSSLPIFVFAVFGYMAGKRYAMAEARFSLTFAIIALVGLGSFMFHATLRRYAQCMDELPMLWTSITMFYNTMDSKPNPDDPLWSHPHNTRIGVRHRQMSKWFPCLPAWSSIHRPGLKLTLVLSGVGLTSIYFYFPALFVIFFIGYSTFLMSFVFIMAFHIFYSERAERKNRASDYETVPLDVVDEHGHSSALSPSSESAGVAPSTAAAMAAITKRPYSRNLGILFWLAIGGYFGGFVFWVFENTYCTALPSWMQLHALWHIMAGLGSFCTVQCQLAWRSEQLGGRTTIDMAKGKGLLPVVVVHYR